MKSYTKQFSDKGGDKGSNIMFCINMMKGLQLENNQNSLNNEFKQLLQFCSMKNIHDSLKVKFYDRKEDESKEIIQYLKNLTHLFKALFSLKRPTQILLDCWLNVTLIALHFQLDEHEKGAQCFQSFQKVSEAATPKLKAQLHYYIFGFLMKFLPFFDHYRETEIYPKFLNYIKNNLYYISNSQLIPDLLIVMGQLNKQHKGQKQVHKTEDVQKQVQFLQSRMNTPNQKQSRISQYKFEDELPKIQQILQSNDFDLFDKKYQDVIESLHIRLLIVSSILKPEETNKKFQQLLKMDSNAIAYLRTRTHPINNFNNKKSGTEAFFDDKFFFVKQNHEDVNFGDLNQKIKIRDKNQLIIMDPAKKVKQFINQNYHSSTPKLENYSVYTGSEKDKINLHRYALEWMIRSQINQESYNNFKQLLSSDYTNPQTFNRSTLNKQLSEYYEEQNEIKKEKLILNIYTKDVNFYKPLNVGLRCITNPFWIVYLRYPVKCLFNAVHKMFKETQQFILQKKLQRIVYRGCLSTQTEIKNLVSLKKDFIQMEGFLSTSFQINVAKNFLSQAKPQKNNFITLFKIHLPFKQVQKQTDWLAAPGFAFICNESYFHQEQEVLFNPLNIFKVKQVYRDEVTYKQKSIQYWIIQLQYSSISLLESKYYSDQKLGSQESEKIKELITSYHHQTSIEVTHQGVLLESIGRKKQAEVYYEIYLKQLIKETTVQHELKIQNFDTKVMGFVEYSLKYSKLIYQFGKMLWKKEDLAQQLPKVESFISHEIQNHSKILGEIGLFNIRVRNRFKASLILQIQEIIIDKILQIENNKKDKDKEKQKYYRQYCLRIQLQVAHILMVNGYFSEAQDRFEYFQKEKEYIGNINLTCKIYKVMISCYLKPRGSKIYIAKQLLDQYDNLMQDKEENEIGIQIQKLKGDYAAYVQRNYQKANIHYQNSILLCSKTYGKNNSIYAQMLGNKGTNLFRISNFKESLNQLYKSEQIQEAVLNKQNSHFATTWSTIAIAQFGFGDYKLGFHYIDDKYRKTFEPQLNKKRCQVSLVLCIPLITLGEYQFLLELSNIFLNRAQQFNNVTFKGIAYAGLCYAEYELGKFQKVKQNIQNAIDCLWKSCTLDERAIQYYNGAIMICRAIHVMIKIGQTKEAKALLDQLKGDAIEKKLEQNFIFPAILDEIGHVNIVEGNFSEAIEILKKSLQIRKSNKNILDNHPYNAQTLFLMGRAYQSLDKLQQAKHSYQQCLTIRQMRFSFRQNNLRIRQTKQKIQLINGRSKGNYMHQKV